MPGATPDRGGGLYTPHSPPRQRLHRPVVVLCRGVNNNCTMSAVLYVSTERQPALSAQGPEGRQLLPAHHHRLPQHRPLHHLHIVCHRKSTEYQTFVLIDWKDLCQTSLQPGVVRLPLYRQKEARFPGRSRAIGMDAVWALVPASTTASRALSTCSHTCTCDHSCDV